MTKEQKILLYLLSCAVNGKTAEPIDGMQDADWEKVFFEAGQQAVSLLSINAIGTAVQKIIPENIYKEQFNKIIKVLARNTRANRVQKELTEILDGAGLPYIILKGESAAAYYPKPEHRALGDVDFLIDIGHTDIISSMIKEKGYKPIHEGHTHHKPFSKAGALLEMHFEIAGIPSGDVGEKVKTFMKDVLASPIILNAGAGDFKGPTERYHAVILLLHMQHHLLGEGIGLRHLCDWACFINKTKDSTIWEEVLIPFLKDIGLYIYAGVMTKLSSVYLGIECPYWATGIEPSVCEELMEDILSGGNFGRKDPNRANSGSMISNHGKNGIKDSKLHNLYCAMRASILEQNPSAEKNKLLYFCLFVYRMFRYIVRVISGKRTAIHKAVGQANKRKEIYEKLHIFEVE